MIPDYAREGLEAYLRDGQPLSRTFADLVSGDIFSAANRADSLVLAALPEILTWIIQEWPRDAYGSPMRYKEWLRDRARRRHAFDFYPVGWPKCPGCGQPALDGHITCGDVACREGERRRREI